MKRLLLLGLLSFATAFTAYAAAEPSPLGGDNTVTDSSPSAFGNPLPLLSDDERERFEEGDDLFDQEFTLQTGLGPIFNAASCEACHEADGRGRPPSAGETGTGLLIRLALNQRSGGATSPDPVYGGQFQDIAAGRTRPEGTLTVSYRDVSGSFADGTRYTLHVPVYYLTDLNYGRLRPEITLSPRLAGQMIGLGLLEAVPDSELLALSDPDDRNGDGISGRPNYVWDTAANRLAIGRFGWKANTPTLLQQTAAAFNGDIGIVSTFASGATCTERERGCGQPTRDDGLRLPPPFDSAFPRPRDPRSKPDSAASPVEIDDADVLTVAFYASSLAVPAQRNATDPQVLRGAALFDQAACSSCHVSELHTGAHPTIAALSNQTIHPYTDLLLHDMGTGLADGQDNFEATGREWRTAPLWGIGLLQTVNGYAYYLHDGRARTLDEAILWHGGEADASRDQFLHMSADDRAALIAFLQSL